MRSLLVLTLLAACELKPPPPKAAPAGSAAAVEAKAPVAAPGPQPLPSPPPSMPTPVPSPPPPVVVNTGSAAPIPTPVVGEKCAAVGVHITDILIANADPTQRTFLEQERGKVVQRSSMSCQRNNWNDAKMACYMAATKAPELDACNKMP